MLEIINPMPDEINNPIEYISFEIINIEFNSITENIMLDKKYEVLLVNIV